MTQGVHNPLRLVLGPAPPHVFINTWVMGRGCPQQVEVTHTLCRGHKMEEQLRDQTVVLPL